MPSFEEFKVKGNTAYKQNNFTDAVNFYKKAITYAPTNPVGYSNCAMALIKLNNYTDASQMCQRGLFYVNEQTDGENKVRQKLQWRLNVCSEQLKDDLISVQIHEVDKLPSKYQDL